MLTFTAIVLQHCIIQQRKQPLEKILCASQAMSNYDLEHTETLLHLLYAD